MKRIISSLSVTLVCLLFALSPCFGQEIVQTGKYVYPHEGAGWTFEREASMPIEDSTSYIVRTRDSGVATEPQAGFIISGPDWYLSTAWNTLYANPVVDLYFITTMGNETSDGVYDVIMTDDDGEPAIEITITCDHESGSCPDEVCGTDVIIAKLLSGTKFTVLDGYGELYDSIGADVVWDLNRVLARRNKVEDLTVSVSIGSMARTTRIPAGVIRPLAIDNGRYDDESM